METEPYLHLSPASTGMTRDFLRVNHTPPSGRTCLTWEVSGLAHTQRNCGWVFVCVCVCLPLQHRLLNRCVLEVLWDYTPVWCPDERLSEWPQDTCSKHNSHPPLWDGAGVNHHLSPLPCTTPGHPEITPVYESGSQPTWSLRPTLCRWHPWQHERCMSAGWKNVTGNVEKRDCHGKTLERGFKASRQ